uniref:Gamma-glutamyltransferase 5a n=1 Tax=Oreochromis aureus TaxID=47969 RepID=A0A668RSX4_OREAU
MKCIVFIFAQQNHLFHCLCSGGKLTLEDLASYEAKVTDAWNISLGEYRMYFPPPPSGGAILSFILNIMKGYKMNSEPKTTDDKILFYHRYIEALKFANGLKKHIRDPRFIPDENLTEDSFANHIRSLISSDKTHDPQYYGKNSYMDSIGTTHLSVLAEDGSAVSVTSTINDEFGSNVLSSSTGIILNNQLNDFCGRIVSSPCFNEDTVTVTWERPPSNMSPSVLKSQSKTLVIGGSGAETIPPAVASVCMHGTHTKVPLHINLLRPELFHSIRKRFGLRSMSNKASICSNHLSTLLLLKYGKVMNLEISKIFLKMEFFPHSRSS